ncbi:MAG TPA: HAD family hydrolase [Terriglobales bacterium]|nr:HAD family hydrolase [Terriglobales bacterium]
MIRAVLFDLGGTLDGPARHWETRFGALYRREGWQLSRGELADAFGHATRAAYADPAMASRCLRETVAFHSRHQLERLGRFDAEVVERVAGSFVAEAEAALAASRAVLQRLRPLVRLGVISNFYGNAERILDDAGITPLLDVVIDSSCVGCSKPEPRIFELALDALRLAPAEVLYVGDSFDKDILPAHRLGLRTAWLVPVDAPPCPEPDAADFTLLRLEDVEGLVSVER